MTKTNETTKEIATTQGFANLEGLNEINEIMAADMAGMEITPDHISIPAGGTTAFEVPDPDGDGESTTMAKEIVGVIVYNHPVNSYYKEKYTGGSNAPDCGSFDGITGIGNPGGNCSNCPFNRFGSGDGNSKACKNRRNLYILREGEIFPLLMSLPTGSLKSFTAYAKRLLTKGRKLNGVVTKITLRKATTAAGIAYSQAVFTVVRALNADEKKAVGVVAEHMKAYAGNLATRGNGMADLGEEVPFAEETPTGLFRNF